MKKTLIFFVVVTLFSGLYSQIVLAADQTDKQQSEEVKKDIPSEQQQKSVEPAKAAESQEQSEEPAKSESELSATIKFGTGITDKEITGEAVTFTPDTGKIYCWSLIEGASEPTEIKHIWYHEGEKLLEVPLNIKYPRTRTWSNKNIFPELTGQWKVEIVDSKGAIVSKAEFTVK